MDDSQDEDIGAIESSLGIARLSMSKSGEITVSPTAAAMANTAMGGSGGTMSPTATGARTGTGTGAGAAGGKASASASIEPAVMSRATTYPHSNVHVGIDKTDSILMKEQKEEEIQLLNENVEMDLSALRGIQPPPEEEPQQQQQQQQQQLSRDIGNNTKGAVDGVGLGGGSSHDKSIKVELNGEEVQDLEALSELVPSLRPGQVGNIAVSSPNNGTSLGVDSGVDQDADAFKSIPNVDSMAVNNGEAEDGGKDKAKNHGKTNTAAESKNVLPGVQEEADDNDYSSEEDCGGDANTHLSPNTNELIHNYTTAKPVRRSDNSSDESYKSTTAKTHSSGGKQRKLSPGSKSMHANKATPHRVNNTSNNNDINNNLQHPYSRKLGDRHIDTPPRPPNHNPNIPDESLYGSTPMQSRNDMTGPGDNNNWNPNTSSGQSISTATQSHEIRMPMFLPTFRPATGCTNASDFIVRCFVARLRSGITVVKHGRSRWCKSRLRILHVHSDGRSLSWKPAQGEPSSSKRPPKLDLSTCLEVRHAWSPDPLNPMFTGTPILRSKCEASNAFKSFALIFPRRTVDITAVTADQCKVLMEGFSALCFRLQVASMAGRGRTGNSVSMTNDEGDSNGGNSGGTGPGGNSGSKAGVKEERGTITTSITGTTNTSKRKH